MKLIFDSPEEMLECLTKIKITPIFDFEKDGEEKEEKKESTKERKEEREEGERDILYNAPAPKKSAAPKHKYGSFGNVLLTDQEYEKLKTKYADIEEKIETMSKAKAAKGYVYKSDYAAILKWNWGKDQPKQKQVNEYPDFFSKLKAEGNYDEP